MQFLPRVFAALLLLANLLVAPTPAQAAQSYDNCTGFITSLPTTISTQGVWCFDRDLATNIASGNAMTINTNNVTIDCNDFKLGGLAAGAGTTTYGIRATSRLNATVRHCNIRGFLYGMKLEGGGHLIEDNRFDGNTHVGLYVAGDGSLVQRNRVNTTGGSTVEAGDAIGIYAVGGVDLLDNSVDGLAPSGIGLGYGNAFGILTEDNLTGSLIGNRVRGLAPLGAGVGDGIYNSASGRISLERNDVVGPGRYGMICSGAQSSAKHNIINGFTTGLLCSNDGGNVVK